MQLLFLTVLYGLVIRPVNVLILQCFVCNWQCQAAKLRRIECFSSH